MKPLTPTYNQLKHTRLMGWQLHVDGVFYRDGRVGFYTDNGWESIWVC